MFGIFRNLMSSTSDVELKEIVKGGAFLVDVRSKSEFASGSVNGAVNIPVDQIQNQINKFKNKKNIVVFCRSGARSSQAKSILERNGIENVYNGGTWNNVQQLIKD